MPYSQANKQSQGLIDDAVLSEEGTEHRLELRKQLFLDGPLKNRHAFRIGGIHCELYETDEEKAPVILFLAGIGTYCELYACLLDEIRSQGFHVVGVDLPGHGYSEGDRGLFTVTEVVESLGRDLDVLELQFEGPFGVYGNSIGSSLGASLAARDTRVKALLGNTMLLPELAPDWLHQVGWQWTWVSAIWMPGYKVPLQQFLDFETLVAHTGADEIVKDDPLLITSYPLKTLSSLFNSRTGLLESGRNISVGILHGDRDEVLPVSYSERVQQKSTFPVELMIAQGQGHMMPWDDCELNARLVADWFKREL